MESAPCITRIRFGTARHLPSNVTAKQHFLPRTNEIKPTLTVQVFAHSLHTTHDSASTPSNLPNP